MTNVFQFPFLPRKAKSARPDPFTAWDYGSEPVEIVAPDEHCATLLLDYVKPLFPAELVDGPGWIVRLQPPVGPAWVTDLLSVVERWLATVPLPCTKLSYGGRDYVIHELGYASQFETPPGPDFQPAA
jgi:hypothetical protein